jgi:four helix bundle protein
LRDFRELKVWEKAYRLTLGRFLQIALGSASELEFHLLLARDTGLLNHVEDERLSQQATEVKRMLTSFCHKLRAES